MLAKPKTTDIHRPLVHAPIAALIVDPNGVVAWGNATAATLLAEPDAGSLRLSLIYMWFGEDDAEALRQMFEVYFNVPADSREAWTRQMLLKAPDGSRPIVSLTLTPVVCEDGERAVVYLRNLTREITAER